MTKSAPTAAPRLTMTWPEDITDHDAPVSDRARDAMMSIDSVHFLRYVASVPGQCTPPWSEHAQALVDAGLIEVAHPGAWSKVDQYGLTPEGEAAAEWIGESGMGHAEVQA